MYVHKVVHNFANMNTITATNARSNFFQLLKDTIKKHAYTTISSKEGNVVMMSEEEFEGIFALPSTATLIPFIFNGPVWAGLSSAQGFGVALSLQRLSVFVQNTGTTGSNLALDVKLDGVSILTSPISVPVGSGDNVGVLVPASQIATTAIPASGVLSAHILTAPDDAESVRLNAWVKPS